jgi:hypothetical protein
MPRWLQMLLAFLAAVTAIVVGAMGGCFVGGALTFNETDGANPIPGAPVGLAVGLMIGLVLAARIGRGILRR